MNFQTRLRKHMADNGMTSSELARLTGIDVTNICHMLSEHRHSRKPSMETLCKVLRALPTLDARWLLLG